MHDLISIGIPVLAILFGILLNRSDVKELRSELKTEIRELRADMNRRFDAADTEMNRKFDAVNAEMNRRFDIVDAELRYFHGKSGEHEARIGNLEKRS